VVPKGLFWRGAQFARDMLIYSRIERAVELDSRKDPHLDNGYAMTSHSSQGQTAERVLIHVDTELSAKCPLNSRMA
jgi:ATP-dependent exoDNAse (exonuclease V) alpha subunit